MVKITEVVDFLESLAPASLQEEYDNAGLITGNRNDIVKSVLVTLDCTEKVVEEAINKGSNLIVAHHPIVFKGLKKLNGNNYVERVIIKAIKNDIAIFAIHTNLDNVAHGVNWKIAEKLALHNIKVLSPKTNTLLKLTVFVPDENAAEVSSALFEAGAGNVGNYDQCKFEADGIGSFRPNHEANPTIGNIGEQTFVKEKRIEVILPNYLKNKVLKAMINSHPYEEVAYYLQNLANSNQEIGAGAIGNLPKPMFQIEFLEYIKAKINLNTIKYTPVSTNKKIEKVALCGGSGSFLLPVAKAMGADAYISSDFKYHEFFDAEAELLIADIGHYESEVYTKDLIHFHLSKKFSNFATLLSEVDTNPVKYYH